MKRRGADITRRVVSDDDDDDDDIVVPNHTSTGDAGGRGTSTQSKSKNAATGKAGNKPPEEELTAEDKERYVKDIVRFALFSGNGEKPFSREDLTKKVFSRLAANPKSTLSRKSFNAVMEEAQRRLYSVFGFNLVNLRDVDRNSLFSASSSTQQSSESVGLASREGANSQTQQQSQRSAGRGSKVSGSSQYVLVNALPEELMVLKESWCGDDVPRNSNAKTKLQAAAKHGLLMVILGFIVMDKGRIGEDTLISRLQTLDADAAFGFSSKKEMVEQLNTFVQQRYLARRDCGPQRPGIAHDDTLNPREYLIGPRTMAEFSLIDILFFIAGVLGQELSETSAKAILDGQQDTSSLKSAIEEAQQRINRHSNSDTNQQPEPAAAAGSALPPPAASAAAAVDDSDEVLLNSQSQRVGASNGKDCSIQ